MSLHSAGSASGSPADGVARGGVPNAQGRPTPHFVVHNKTDTVGVVVVETVHAGDQLSGWVMETDETITVTAQADIPLGHKVAIRPIKTGDTILKYEHDIGRAIEDIGQGGYVHYHNVKTKRW
ncbi:UxaA family hydrolase [Arenibaculum sp.]|jgi:(2R)-sulfolactate sulfo-lyase subunit alpha|uniref:UxaA family hydrolase n=1 Tax=Arenibaculum sp. TaxID=2865862 RepID=UPI002E0DDB7A|nr:UxaA family hydrolase [Arenibaculum sp.]